MKINKNFVMLLILVAVGVIFISGCIQQKEYVCPDGNVVSDSTLCSNQNANKIYLPEPEQPKYSDCDKFLSKQEKQSCKMGVAIAIGDMGYCSTAYKDDPSHDLPTNIASCLNNIYIANREKITFSDCDYYQHPPWIEACKLKLIVLKGEPLLCETLNDKYDKDRCYSDVAETTKDKTICNNIKSTESKYECIDKITKRS